MGKEDVASRIKKVTKYLSMSCTLVHLYSLETNFFPYPDCVLNVIGRVVV